MNISNLSQDELKTLHSLLGKVLEQPKEKTQMDQTNELIDNIIENFDWTKTHRTMTLLNWEWAIINRVPTIEDLKKSASKLLMDAANLALKQDGVSHEIASMTGSGGLEATAYANNRRTKIIQLELRFVLAWWEADSL